MLDVRVRPLGPASVTLRLPDGEADRVPAAVMPRVRPAGLLTWSLMPTLLVESVSIVMRLPSGTYG